MIKIFFILAAFLILFISCTEKPAVKECCKNPKAADSHNTPSSESIYQLNGNWTSQYNHPVALEGLKGKIQVVAMIFTHCGYACPRIVADIKELESKLPADKKDKVGFVLVSFDSERDSSQRLKEFYEEMALNKNWILLHGDDQQVRELSVLLNVQYEKQPDGNFSHSNLLTVLDSNGGIYFQQEELGKDPRSILSEINKLIQ